MKAIVTVVGPDRVGIIGEICTLLAGMGANIVDISQTVMKEYFTMIMLVDLSKSDRSFGEVQDALTGREKDMGLSIRIQREDTFRSMYRV